MGRRHRTTHLDIWPAFTDAIIAILLVFVFVVAIQIILNRILTDRNARLSSTLNEQDDGALALIGEIDQRDSTIYVMQTVIDSLLKETEVDQTVIARITEGEVNRKREQQIVENLIDNLKVNTPDIELELDGSTQTLTFGDKTLFQTASSDLKPTGRDIFIRLVRDLTDPANNITSLKEIQVSGHTDNVPTGKISYTNWELSTDRAVKVVRFLQDQGIDPSLIKLTATGYGEFDPIATNITDDGKARNRRVELRLVYTEQIDE